MSKTRSTGGQAESQAKAGSEVELEDIDGRQAEETKAKAREDPDGDVEHRNLVAGEQVDVEAGEEETKGGQERPGKTGPPVAEPLDQAGHRGSNCEGKPGHDTACKGCLCSRDLNLPSHLFSLAKRWFSSVDLEMGGDSRKEESIGVAEADLDERDGKGSNHYQPGKAAVF